MAVRALNATPEELTKFTDFLRSQPELPYTKTKLGKLLNKRFPHYSVQQYRKSQFVSDFLAELIQNPPLKAEPERAKTEPPKTKPKGDPTYSWKEDQQTAEVTFVTEKKRIVTFDDAIQASGADLSIWEAERWIFNKWEMGFKEHIKERSYKVAEETHKEIDVTSGTQDLIQVRIWFRRKKAGSFDIDKARESVIQAMQAHAPVYRSFKRQPIADGHLLVLDPADSHFGKLAHYYSTGDTYTLDVAKERIVTGFEGLLNKAQGFPVDRFLLVLGNDMLHVDNSANTTTGNTRQDVSSMWHEAFRTAKQTFIQVIEGLAVLGDVDVVFNPSNHDYVSGWMLFDSIQSWFHKSKNISFDGSLLHRKYYQYYQSQIGTTHGNGVKPQELIYHMANEAKEMWAATKYRYWYYHHIHHMDKLKYKSGKDFVGGTVQSVRSISGTDRWHMDAGYTGVPKALEAFVHSKQHGQVAQLTHVF
jgi:hypothetical protein